MKINIYINDQPLENYSAADLEKIKAELTLRALAAAGYERAQKDKK